MKQVVTMFLVFSCFSLLAQDVVRENKHKTGQLVLKWSPLHLLNHYSTFQVALEHRVAKNISLQYDFGPVVNLDGSNTATTFDKRGFKAKFEIRRYILPYSRHWQFYYGTEIYFNRVNYKKSDTYQVNCTDGQCDYFQNITSGMKYREPGINLKTGTVFHVYRFCIDFQVGIAARFIHYSPMSLPDPAIYRKEDNEDLFGFGPIERTRNTVSPTACVRFGYILKYRKSQ